MFKVIDPDAKDIHELHMFPIDENTDKHDFNQDCWCQPHSRNITDYTELQFLEDDDSLEHVIVEHNRTDH